MASIAQIHREGKMINYKRPVNKKAALLQVGGIEARAYFGQNVLKITNAIKLGKFLKAMVMQSLPIKKTAVQN